MQNQEEKISGILRRIDEINAISFDLNNNILLKSLEDVKEKLTKNDFLITVVGEFNRGKSTLINAMLGENLLPVSVRPTTAFLHIIRYGQSPSIKIHFKELPPRVLPFSPENLSNFTAFSESNSSAIRHIEILYPAEFLKDGVTIIDTPGVNDIDEQRLDITYGYMPLSDAVIFILDATTPFKMTEKIFLEEKILSNNIRQIFFLVNKSDGMNRSEIEESLNYFREKLKAIVKDADLKLFHISTKQAIEGIITKNNGIIECSNYPEFIVALTNFLNSEDKLETKIKKAKANLIIIEEQILAEIDSEDIQLSQSFQQLIDLQKSLENRKNDHKKSFDELLRYADDQQQRLIGRIESSLYKTYKELENELIYYIDIERKDLSAFAEKEFPRRTNLTIKRWVENNKPLIDGNLKEIIGQITVGFNKHFSKLPVLRSMIKPVDTEISDEISGVHLDGEGKIKNIGIGTYGAGLVLAGTIVTFITGGIGYPVFMAGLAAGGISKKLFGGYLVEKEIQDQKRVLNEQIPNILKDQFSQVLQNIKAEIARYFVEAEEQLKKEYDSTYCSIDIELKEKLEQRKLGEKAIEKRRNTLSILKQRIMRLGQEV